MTHTLSDKVLLKPSFLADLTNAAVDGTSVDTFGYRHVTLFFYTTTGSATTATVKVKECATVGGSYTDITGAHLATPILASQTGVLWAIEIDPARHKRFLLATVTGTGTAGQAMAAFLLSSPKEVPVTQDNAAIKVDAPAYPFP